jgi:hypothetical protein
MLKESPGGKFRDRFTKSLMRKLAETFGLQHINDTLAQICFEEANIRQDYFFDEISERYDEINRIIKFRHLQTK